MTEHVLDANVFIHGASRSIPFEDAVTVPAVTAELESTDARVRMDVEQVPVYQPSDAAVDRVRGVAEDRGEALSEADVAVVALAVDRDAVVVSDDYGVQNVCEALDVAYEPFQQDGIEDGVDWMRVCADCGKKDVAAESCPRCGGDVVRRSR